MEHGSQKTAVRIVVALMAAQGLASALEFEVRHERLWKDRPGRLVFEDSGVEFRRAVGDSAVRWEYGDIQELRVSPAKVVIVTYVDRRWLGGIDREFEFHLTQAGGSFAPIYQLLKDRLDQRLVAALAGEVDAQWEVRAKLLGMVRGSEGVLRFGADRVVYITERKGESRTWRYEDIENASTSGPFEMTLTTYERRKLDYGGMRAFRFQLKERLDGARFDAFWRRLQRGKGLEFLTSMEGVGR